VRVPFIAVAVLGTALIAATPACAFRLILPDDGSPAFATAPPADQVWQPQRPETQLVERPIADLIAARLGLVKGSAELFRYHLVNAPTNNAMLRGQIDGAGIKLKLTW
jgi:hypothetical protein